MSDSNSESKRQKLSHDDQPNPTNRDSPTSYLNPSTSTSAESLPVWDIPAIAQEQLEIAEREDLVHPTSSLSPPHLDVGGDFLVSDLGPPDSPVSVDPVCSTSSLELLSPTLGSLHIPVESDSTIHHEAHIDSSVSTGIRNPLPHPPPIVTSPAQFQQSHLPIGLLHEPFVPESQILPLSSASESIYKLNQESTSLDGSLIDVNEGVVHEANLYCKLEVNVPGQEELRHDFDEPSNLECDVDNASVTSDFDYEQYYDASEYFTTEEDPFERHCELLLEPREGFLESNNPQENTEENQPCSDPPLYQGSKVTVSETSTAFLSLMLSNDISGELLGRILSFIQLILPSDNKFFSSLHSFLKYFDHFSKSPAKFIYYCSSCLRGLEEQNSVCTRCGPNVKVNYYLNMPLIPQIKCLYSNPAFLTALSHRFSRSKIVEGNLEDIYDGQLYKSASNILSHPYNISFSWNTDGISLFNSSNFQVWPFYLTINELPPHLRFKEEYMILAGLAFGYEKPAFNIFLKPICNDLEILKEGIDVAIPHSESQVNIKCILLCGTCDAPAKSAIFRFTNFNGSNGCPRCLALGEYDRLNKVFTYPFEDHITLRTYEGYLHHLRCIQENNSAVCGVQGPTYLFKMVSTFFVESTSVDVMHNVYLGVTRQIFYLWFSSAFIKKVFGENAERTTLFKTFSVILCNMAAPHYMSRPPRSLLSVKFFKAKEFRTWLFSTALPLVEKTMNEPYLEHFKMFVCSIALLNQASVSLEDIATARSLLTSFVREFQELYGKRNMLFNVHSVLHLPDVTLALGPLWVSSCFGYESLNGRLARLVHGTRHAGLQIYSHLGLLRNLKPLINSVSNISVKQFCDNMVSKSTQYKITEMLEKDVLILGGYDKEHVLPPNFNDVLCQSINVPSNISFFFRLKQGRYLYVAEDYGRGSRNSSCVQYRSSSGDIFYGSVKVFFKLTECQCTEKCDHLASYFALINRFDCSVPFHTSQPNVPITSLLSCVPCINDIHTVPMQNIMCVCFKVDGESSSFLSVPLNPYELE